jgi:hypothetical protein
VGVSLALSLLMFAPSLWQFAKSEPGSLVWARGLGYASQCIDPGRHDVEPALQWRLLPPLVAHALGLRGVHGFLLSWAGLLLLLGYVANATAARLPRRVDALFATVLVGTTSAVFTATGWLGLNDGWLWFAVLAASFGRASAAWPLACLGGPWIDERFILGFPLIIVVRWLDRRETPSFSRGLAALAWLLPYAMVRGWLTREGWGGNSSGFLEAQLHATKVWLPFAPLGWWLGLRAGWIAVGTSIIAAAERGKIFAVLLVAALLTGVGASTVLASDLSRSIAIALPALVFGCVAAAERWPTRVTSLLGGTCLLNLFLPAGHVVYTQVHPISPLPIELARLLR